MRHKPRTRCALPSTALAGGRRSCRGGFAGIERLLRQQVAWGVAALVMFGQPLALSAQDAPGPYLTERLLVPEHVFDFGTVMEDEPVFHVFTIANTGRETLEITNVRVTAPLFFQNVRKQLLPGERRDIIINLGIPRKPGEYAGWMEVAFKDPGLTNLIFDVRGKIVPLIELKPFPGFFVATQRGQPKQGTVEIINHEPEPLEIRRIEQTGARFTTELKTVDPGQRYTLTLNLDGKGAPGRATETIKLFTSSKKRSLVQLKANTYIKERVYTFPESLDLGQLRADELKGQSSLTNYLSQTLMVYQSGGTNFQVTAMSDSPFLRLSTEPSRKYRDRCQITAEIVADRLVAGPLNSRIKITTNDREFPTLEVPVTGTVVR